MVELYKKLLLTCVLILKLLPHWGMRRLHFRKEPMRFSPHRKLVLKELTRLSKKEVITTKTWKCDFLVLLKLT